MPDRGDNNKTNQSLETDAPDKCRGHGNKGTEQSRRENLRRTGSRPIGVRWHTMAIGSDIQYRDLLHLRSDQNCHHFTFPVHNRSCH